MASKLSLFLVDSTKQFVVGINNGGIATVGPFVLGDITPVELTLLTPNPAGGIANPFSVIRDQQVVKVALGTPSSSPAATVVAQGTLAYVASGGSYSGSLNCATQQFADYLGANTSASAVFECQVVSGNSGIFTAQKSTTLLADLIKEGAFVNLAGTDAVYTAGQTDSLFLAKNRTDSITSQTTINVLTSAQEVKFVRDDARTFSFGSHTGAAWSNNDNTLVTRSDVVLKTGGTFSGAPYYGAAPTNANQLANKAYVDLHLPLTGGTLSGPVHSSGTTGGHPRELANVEFVLANASTPQVDSTLSFTGSILGVTTSAGSLMSYTHLHDTGQVLEAANQYFTQTRVRATSLNGLDTATAGAVTDTHTVLQAIGLLQASKVSSSSGSFATAPGFPLGSAGVPAVAPLADTNTGIFFSGADALAFSAGGAEIARINGAGLLIGSGAQAGRFSIVGGSNQTHLAITAHSAQTTDIMQWYDAASALAGRITRYGGLAISTDGVSAADVKGIRITATSSSGDAGLYFLNNIGGGASSIRLLGSGGSPSSALVIENSAASDVCLRADGLDIVRVREAGYVELTNPVVKVTGGLAVEGSLWQNSSDKTIKSFVAGIEQALPGVIFTGNADKSIASSSSETSIVPTGTGGLTLAPNFWTVGKTIRVTIVGLLRSKASGPGTFNVRAKLGSTVITATGGFVLEAALSDVITNIELWMTCRSVGATGTIRVMGTLEHLEAAAVNRVVKLFGQGGGSTADTTASALLDLTGQFSVSDSANTWSTVNCVFEVLN